MLLFYFYAPRSRYLSVTSDVTRHDMLDSVEHEANLVCAGWQVKFSRLESAVGASILALINTPDVEFDMNKTVELRMAAAVICLVLDGLQAIESDINEKCKGEGK